MTMKLKIEPGERLRQLRVKRKVSQAALADAIFVKNTTISNWEKGTRKIQTDNLKSLSDFFGVPVSYFLEAEEKTESWRRVPIKALLAGSAAVAMLVSLTVVALNGRTNLNNEACYGEQVCYLIEDPSIVSELSSRNITGGLMTNVEMDLLADFLFEYREPETYDVSKTLIKATFHANNGKEVLFSQGDGVIAWSNVYQYFINYNPDSWWNTYLHIRNINPEIKQLFYLEENNTKIVIYKTALNTFKYEVWGDQIDVLSIDLNVNRLYLNNELVVKSLYPDNQVIDSYFDSLIDDRWIDPNGELHGFINYGNNLYLAYNFAMTISSEQHYAKNHRIHIMDVNKNVSYYLELSCGCSSASGGVVSIYRYENEVDFGNQQIMVSSRVTTDTKFDLRDFESLFTNSNVFIPEWWSTSGSEGVVEFFEELDDAIIFPALEIDFTPVPIHNPFTE